MMDTEAKRAELEAVVPDSIIVDGLKFGLVRSDGLRVLWIEDWQSGCDDTCECPHCPGETLKEPTCGWVVRFRSGSGMYAQVVVDHDMPAHMLLREIEGLSGYSLDPQT